MGMKSVTSRYLPAVAWVAVLLAFFAFPAFGQAADTGMRNFDQNVKEVYFPFNSYNRIVDRKVLDSNAAWLKNNPDTKMWIMGYADPRGDIVYNLVLSYRRALWVKSQLVKRGVDGSRVGYATGWGKLYQTCDTKDDRCFQQNRRVNVVSPDAMMFHGTP